MTNNCTFHCFGNKKITYVIFILFFIFYFILYQAANTANCTSSRETTSTVTEHLTCKTEKNTQMANKHRTAGLCCAVYNCGIVVAVTELFGSESLTQVYLFLIWMWKTLLLFPHLLAYDDACQLKRFCNKRLGTVAARFIANLIMVVDKLHFKNHIDKWCRQNVNPHKVKEFNDLNTEACEQTFVFISKFKHATKHMSFGRYNLFHLTMCDIYNNDKLVRNVKRSRSKN